MHPLELIKIQEVKLIMFLKVLFLPKEFSLGMCAVVHVFFKQIKLDKRNSACANAGGSRG